MLKVEDICTSCGGKEATTMSLEKSERTVDVQSGKYVGDAIMAFWGAPLPQENYVMNAARAVMDMSSGAKKLSEELERQSVTP